MQKDNSTFYDKVKLRRKVLAVCDKPPMVFEPFGGWGRLYERTWFKAAGGLVIEKDDAKAEHLAKQRPTWSVYQGDCEKAIAAGLGAKTAFDIIDLDPYGQSMSILRDVLKPGRTFPDVVHIIANDGARRISDWAAHGR